MNDLTNIKNIMTFMMRTDLKGNEVPSFNDAMMYLESLLNAKIKEGEVNGDQNHKE